MGIFRRTIRTPISIADDLGAANALQRRRRGAQVPADVGVAPVDGLGFAGAATALLYIQRF